MAAKTHHTTTQHKLRTALEVIFTSGPMDTGTEQALVSQLHQAVSVMTTPLTPARQPNRKTRVLRQSPRPLSIFS